MPLRRSIVTVLLATVLAVAAPAGAAASPVAAARLVACDAQARTADFAADMRAVPGAVALQLRFTLLVREDGWDRVPAPTFDQWTTAAPGRIRYVYDKRVENLPAGAYRVRVRFRWRDAAGRVLRTAVRRSKSCRIPDPRPDLVPVRIDVRPGATSETREYAVTVANQGRVASPAFDVALVVDGVPLRDRTSPGLAPGERSTTVFVGPPCPPGGTLVASVDATGLVDEAREADDTLTVACPPT